MKLFSLFISIIIFCAPSFSQETYPVNGVAETFSPIYALTNAHIVISSKKEIANGTILIQDGKILGVDSLLDIPEGSIIKDMKGDFIYPAFIDIYSDYGLEKIKKGEFKENDFYKMSNTNEIKIEKIELNNSSDDKLINKKLVKQVYTLPVNKVGIFYDDIKGIYYLIQIDKVKNASIEANSENYEKYLIKSNARIIQDIYTSYDMYLNDKYKVEINYNTLDNVKNSF